MKDLFFQNYINNLYQSYNSEDIIKFNQLSKFLLSLKKNKKKLIIVGNGGSAAIASHVAVDFTKICKIRAINFNEANLITCYGNDYGYENWVSEALKSYADKGDLVILISSSGQSKNIINAAKYCKKNNLKLITFSGFKKNNPLKKIGKINFWVNSESYNIIEMTHQVWLLILVDFLSKFKK
jgi:D-sedoheptulose 7-phosphate isomerase